MMVEARAVLQGRDAGGLDQHGAARGMRMRGFYMGFEGRANTIRMLWVGCEA